MINKYRNKKVEGFDSKAEANDFMELKLLERAGLIKYLQRQVRIKLTEYPRKIIYVADFIFLDKRNNQVTIWDTKGIKLPEFDLKRAWILNQYTGYIFITNYRSKGIKETMKPADSATIDLRIEFENVFIYNEIKKDNFLKISRKANEK